MSGLTTKRRLLKEAGFVYNFDRDLYCNRTMRKAFSVEFIEDHTETELQDAINEITDREYWRFYFNTAPSKAVEHELESVLG